MCIYNIHLYIIRVYIYIIHIHNTYYIYMCVYIIYIYIIHICISFIYIYIYVIYIYIYIISMIHMISFKHHIYNILYILCTIWIWLGLSIATFLLQKKKWAACKYHAAVGRKLRSTHFAWWSPGEILGYWAGYWAGYPLVICG